MKTIRLHKTMGMTAALAGGLLLGGGPASLKARAEDVSSNAAPADIVNYTYEVVNTYPHDPRAFTEGLLFLGTNLLESTGQYKDSTLRLVDLPTGNVLKQYRLNESVFGEGATVLGDKIYQLSWKEGTAFVYDAYSFVKTNEFSYAGEGWGLTTDGHWLIMSDGSSTLKFIDPATFKIDHTVQVTKSGAPLANINELEYVKGQIYANVWKTDWLARIDPATGNVVGMADLRHLLTSDERSRTDVLNGIAYDAARDRLFVTGKYWPKIFEIRLKAKGEADKHVVATNTAKP